MEEFQATKAKLLDLWSTHFLSIDRGPSLLRWVWADLIELLAEAHQIVPFPSSPRPPNWNFQTRARELHTFRGELGGRLYSSCCFPQSDISSSSVVNESGF